MQEAIKYFAHAALPCLWATQLTWDRDESNIWICDLFWLWHPLSAALFSLFDILKLLHIIYRRNPVGVEEVAYQLMGLTIVHKMNQ